MASDLLTCDLGSAPVVACPLRAGGVTFHHGKMPHMTTANSLDRWRLTVAQHFCHPAHLGEGDRYPWRVMVDQNRLKAPATEAVRQGSPILGPDP